MSTTQSNVKQLKPGTNNQILLTTGGVVTWGNPLATTSALGEVQLATQSQAFNGSPDLSGSNPLVVQPSGMLIRRNQTAGNASIFLMATDNPGASPPTIATANTRGVVALDLQTRINASTQVASGSHSIAIGMFNTTSSSFSQSIGYSNTNGGYKSVVIGIQNTQSSASQNNHLFGTYNTNLGVGSTANTLVMGTSNTLSGGQNNIIIGAANTQNTSNFGNTIIGNNNTSGVNAAYAGLIGRSNTGAGNRTFLVGSNNVGNDSPLSFLFGASNTIQSGSSYCFGLGTSNSFSTTNSGSNDLIAIGKLNVLDSITNSIAIGISNNLQGTSSQQNLMAFGNGNTVFAPANGFGTCGCFGQGNTIGANSARSWAFGEGNFVQSINYGNGAGIACAVGTSNTIHFGELVYLFGHGNVSQTDNSNTVFADYIVGLGISNTATPAAHQCTLTGISNASGGSRNSLFGFGNTALFGDRNTAMGFSNTVGFYNGASDNNIGGSYNTIGTNSTFTNIFGRGNATRTHCNIFGQSNNLNRGTGSYNNIFGRNNNSSAGGGYPTVTNCEVFGTNNVLGSINNSSADCIQGITFGTYNQLYSNQTVSLGANNITFPASLKSTVVGWNNILDNKSVNSVAIGNNNTLANYGAGTGSQSSIAIGDTNKIGRFEGSVFGIPASNAVAIGSHNQATSDNDITLGYANFTGASGFTNLTRSVISIGILNNGDRVNATINDATGIITGTPFPNIDVGINSIAFGSENLTTGLNSVALGRHCDATATEALAVGVRAVANGVGATAIGDRAVARLASTINFAGVPIIRKDNGESVGTEMLAFAGMPCIIESKAIDLKTAQIYLIQLPALTNAGGMRFWTDEVGIHVVSKVEIVTVTPFCSWGTQLDFGFGPVTNQKYKTNSQMTGLDGEGTRECFTTLEADDGETSDERVNPVRTVWLLARINTPGVCSGPWTGRFFWKGRFIEQ